MGASRSPVVDRRAVLRLLGIGAGAGFASTLTRTVEGSRLALQGARVSSTPQRGAARGAVIRTVLKDIAPEQLGSGTVLFHEHLSVNFQRGKIQPGSNQPIEKDDVDAIVELVKKAGAERVSCIVDGGHADMGRDLGTLREVAARTRVHIVASGGYYTQVSYPSSIATKSEDEIAEDVVREAMAERYGAFGEIGQAPNLSEMTPDERKVFRAIGKAHVRTGIPIFTHNA